MNDKTSKSGKQPAVFLDRDGTLIEEVNFLHKVEDLRFFSYTDESVKMLKEAGYLVVVATNQSGIGRRIYTLDDMHLVHQAIQERLSKKIDAFFFCPHLPDADCRCRKPGLGMVEQALESFDIDIENSWMVGDKALDIGLGENAGMKTALVLTGYGAKTAGSCSPSLTCETLYEAVLQIIKKRPQRFVPPEKPEKH